MWPLPVSPLSGVRRQIVWCHDTGHWPMMVRYQGLSLLLWTNGAQMGSWWSLHREWRLLHSYRESGEVCWVFKKEWEVLRIIDLQTAKKSAMIMKLSVANSSHCCGWGGDKSKHRTTALQHFHYIGDWCIDVVASQEYKTVYTETYWLFLQILKHPPPRKLASKNFCAQESRFFDFGNI